MIISLIKLLNHKTKITYMIKNNYFNENYRGYLLINYNTSDMTIFNNFNKYGKWVYVEFDTKGHILRLYN